MQKTERDYKEWMDERKDAVLRDFKELLKETKIITYRSLKSIQENEQHLKDILAVLEVCLWSFRKGWQTKKLA